MGDVLIDRQAEDGHPALEELQRCADGELDPAGDAGLVAHVQACAACRAEIEQLRRVTAALCLASAPPADLFERIKTRRDSGERVLLPSVASVEEQPVDARPTMVSAPPSASVATHRPHRRRAWRWIIGPVGVAAAVLFAVRLAFEGGSAGDGPAGVRVASRAPAESVGSRAGNPIASVTEAPGAAQTRSAPPGAGAAAEEPGGLRGARISADSSPASDWSAAGARRVTKADSSRVSGGAEPGSFVVLRETQEGLVIRLATASRFLDPRQAQALDSAVRVLRQNPERQTFIRYVDPSFNRESGSWHLAVRAEEHLVGGGIAPERIRLVRLQALEGAELPPHLGAVEVVVKHR